MKGSADLEWRAALASGRFEEAQRLYLLTDELDPDVRRSLAVLADVAEFVREKAWPRALRRVERLEEKPPLIDWGELWSELEGLSSSSQSLDKREPESALQILADTEGRWFRAEAANQRGTAHIQSGEIELAREQFERAVELDPRHYRALTNLGNALLESDLIEEAISCYQKAIALNDGFANAHHNLGVAYRRQGKVGLSVRQLRRAQREQQRSEREIASARLGDGAGRSGMKMLRWVLYGVMALVLFLILRNQGLF